MSRRQTEGQNYRVKVIFSREDGRTASPLYYAELLFSKGISSLTLSYIVDRSRGVLGKGRHGETCLSKNVDIHQLLASIVQI